jgi:hypothetical protein
MKTKQELFDQFQYEFDRKRRSSIWFSLIIAHIVGGLYVGLLVSTLPYPWVLKIVFVMIAEIILLVMSFLVTITEDSKNFNSKSLNNDTIAKLENLKSDVSLLKTYQTEQQEHLDKKNGIIAYMQNPEVTVVTPNPIWPNYIIGMAKMDEEKIADFQKEIEIKKNLIHEFEIKLQFYDQVPEKNFWQYIKSMKWTKKIKKCKT